MAAEGRSTGNSLPNDDVIAVSDEALQKAEAFIEAEEGAANRLMGWPGTISTAIAVVMSLFHLYAAYAIVPTQELRYIHVAFTLVLSFLLFPLATRFPQPRALVGRGARHLRGRDHRLCAVGRRRFHRPRHLARPPGRHRRHRLHRAAAGSDAPHHRADHAGGVAVASSPTRCSARICRRPGPIAATTCRAWSAISSSRWKAFSASRSTSRRR